MAPRNAVRINRPRRILRLPAPAIVAVLALFALVACNEGQTAETPVGPTVVRPSPEGEPRPFAMGFSSMPAEETVESYVQAFATAAQYGELLLINRAPPWTEFFPNGQPSEDTLGTTRLETRLLDQYEGLRLVYAIDPTDPAVSRNRLVDLPSSVSQAEGFTNEHLRNAFIGYALYVLRNYEPEYLALGVEVNMLRSRNREQFNAFVSLYNEAYAAVKESRPETKVFPTFQLEDLEGNLGDLHPPDWQALEAFSGRMDVLAISTYPYLGELQSANDLRDDYYSQLRDRWEGEVLIVETAYASAPVPGERTLASEQDQDTFLQRLLADAEAAEFSGVIWRAALDPTFATAGTLTAFRDIGLRHGDGANKQAWGTWEAWARRPLER